MHVTHPYARRDTTPPSAATINGTTYRIDSDGVVDAPADVARALADAWGRRYDVDPDELLGDEETADTADDDSITPADVEAIADEIIAEKITDGTCPWCDEYDGENVGMHASRAHPEAWADYTEA